MASDLVTPGVDQRCIIKFLSKPAETLPRLNAQCRERTMSRAAVYDWYNKFPESRKEISNLSHAHVQPTT
jgi:hypothetical protein